MQAASFSFPLFIDPWLPVAAEAAAAKTTTEKGGLLFLFVPKTLLGHKIEMENCTFGQAFLRHLASSFPVSPRV